MNEILNELNTGSGGRTESQAPDHDGAEGICDVIVVGAGASGLFYAAGESIRSSSSMMRTSCDPAGCSDVDICQTTAGDAPRRKLILEKTSHAGAKLLMSGNGMCNITHSGSIKDFIGKYGENGRLIRSCLYRHNNLELMDMMERLGVHLAVREDGKVFPETMRSKDVLDALMRTAESSGWNIKYNAEVAAISFERGGNIARSYDHQKPDALPADNKGSDESSADHDPPDIKTDTNEVLIGVTLSDGSRLTTRKLVIACGGSSYPSTGSDGSLLKVLSRDLGVSVKEPRPALAPVFVQDFSFSGISGVSLPDVKLRCRGHEVRGPMLMTHKGFSGPAVLHMSQYVNTGDTLTINFIPDKDHDAVAHELKTAAPGNKAGTANFIASEYGLPRSFVEQLLEMIGKRPASSGGQESDMADNKMSSLSGREMALAENKMSSSLSGHSDGITDKKLSSLSGREIDMAAEMLTKCAFSVSGTGGWNDAMVTAGGVTLDCVDLKTMRLKNSFPDIRIIGEVLDVNGDTGGYNLQFAYSTAMAAL